MSVRLVNPTKQRWPYHHQTAVTSEPVPGGLKVKVYCRHTPGVWFFMIVAVLALVLLIIGGLAMLKALDHVSGTLRP